ncbi:MAG: putative General secretion pathway protein D [Candidatus Nitrospira kreftii]|uniref:Putative General secretion pathway protein D n=1 Tax=Candidatus Nitrospira kreftii TaxID=2652173 RepID=A0A7S8FD58_9BACT|nr:MAG: putative General secretion pathway protein D [Candidatus Nitrospira kreftii]
MTCSQRVCLYPLSLLLLTGCSLFISLEVKRGDQHLAGERWEAASLAYKEALKDDPFNSSLQGKYALSRERTAAMYAERGRTFIREQRADLALEEFKRSLTIEPSNAEYQAGFQEATRLKESRSQYREAERLAQLGRVQEALGSYARAVELDPKYQDPLEGITRLTEDQQALRRAEGSRQPVTLKFKNAGIKEILEGVAKAGGLTLVFDKDVRNDPISIAIQDTPFEEALRLILNSNSLFSRQISPTVTVISPDTKQKQEQYQDLMIRTFYLSTAKAKDMVILLKSMLDSKRMHANEQLNAIVIRDQPEKLELAEKIILANDRQEPEVLFDLEVLEVNRTKNQTYGLNYPKQAGAGLIASGFTGTLAAEAVQMTYRQLTNLGPDSYLFKLPTTVLLDFFKQQSDAKTLASPKIRVINNKKAEINIGDKQPILLSTTNVLPGQATTGAVPTTSTVTSIEFRDTGVKLTVEPSIRLGNELSLKMKVEVIRVGDQITLQASPLIQQFKFGNRSAETTLNMRDGETIVLGGLLQEEDRRTRVTMPWIGDLPLIGNLLSSFKTERVTTEVILTITPRIAQPALPPGSTNQAFWSGTEFNYSTNPVFSGSAGSNRLGAPLRGAVLMKPAQSLTKLATPGPALQLKPDDSVVQSGKEVTIAIVDGRIRASGENTFRFEYDPDILEFQRLDDGQLVTMGETTTERDKDRAGAVVFQLAHPDQRAPRTMNLTFVAKAPGVSPVRVELSHSGTADEASSEAVGSGIVRVR